VKFSKFCEIGEIVRHLPDKKTKNSLSSQTVATACIAPKFCHCRASHLQGFQTAPDFILIQIGSLSAEL